MNECCLRQWEMRPPPGGWRVNYTERGRAYSLKGSPPSIVERIAVIQKEAGTFNGYTAIWDYCNAIWCRRDPARCLLEKVPDADPAPSEVDGKDHREITPTEYGPALWLYLNTFGMTGQFDKTLWSDTISRILKMFDPDRSPMTGCDKCLTEFRSLIESNPIENVNSSADAARWIFKIHNRVNERLGKPRMLFAKAACSFGWDIDLPK